MCETTFDRLSIGVSCPYLIRIEGTLKVGSVNDVRAVSIANRRGHRDCSDDDDNDHTTMLITMTITRRTGEKV